DSVAVGADDLAAGTGAEGHVGGHADRVLDEADAAVAHQEVGAAGVGAAVAGDVSLQVGAGEDLRDRSLQVDLYGRAAEGLVHAVGAVDAVRAELPDRLAACDTL